MPQGRTAGDAQPAEAWLLGRPFIPLLGWPMLVIALLCQAGRIWIIRSLGQRHRSLASIIVSVSTATPAI